MGSAAGIKGKNNYLIRYNVSKITDTDQKQSHSDKN